MPDIICLYHRADLDGKCSAAIVRKHYAPLLVECIGMDYGDPVPWERLHDQTVVMVDFSLSFNGNAMWRLKGTAKTLIWIDHHETAIEEASAQSFGTPGLREVGRAGCELTWDYFMACTLPRAVELLGRYDVWDHTDPDVLPFQYGMRLKDWNPEDPAWESLLSCLSIVPVDKILAQGMLLYTYEQVQNALYARERSYPVTVPTDSIRGSLRGLACNKGLASSTLLDSVFNPEQHDLMVLFCKLPGPGWTVSLRSSKPDVDCGAIAKHYRGGGHRGAAGFRCALLPAWLEP